MYQIDGNSVEMLKKIVSFGCMCSAALASPILSEKPNIWFLDVLVFFASTAASISQHQVGITMYGPFTFVAAIILGLVAYSSARPSLKELAEFVPWIPFTLCLFVLLTVLLPTSRQSFNEDNVRMEEGRSIYSTAPFGPGSVRSDRSVQSRQQSVEMVRWIQHDTSHMSGPASQHSGGQSTRESDIDLNDMSSDARVVAQRMVSPSRPGYSIGTPPQTFSDRGFPFQTFALAVPNFQRTDYAIRSMSPDSVAVEDAPSTSARSESPLLA